MRIYTKTAAKYYDLKLAKEVERAPKEIIYFKQLWGNKVKCVLDVACGTGRLSVELSKKDYDVTGIDTSENMLEIARGKKSGARFLKADMRTYHAKKTFDAIVCGSNTLNHLLTDKELLKALRNFHRNLKKGGMLIFDVFPAMGKGYKGTYKRKAGKTSMAFKESVTPMGSVVDWQSLMHVNDNGKKMTFSLGCKLAWRTRKEWLSLLKQAGFRKMRVRKKGIKEFYVALN